jgi:CSLREA domain-containing protein
LAPLAVALASAEGAEFHVTTSTDGVDANPGDGICATIPNTNVCTLRAAVMEANALPGKDVIYLSNFLYELGIPAISQGQNSDSAAHGDLDVEDDVKIAGAHQSYTTISSQDARILDVPEGISVEVSDLQLRDVVLAEAGETSCGLAVRNAGTLLMEQVWVRENSGKIGAICNTGAITLKNSIVSENSASATGNGAGLYNIGHAELSGGFIDGNHSSGMGGGIYNEGTIVIGGTSIHGNTADGGGGGIYNRGQATIVRSLITGNSAGVEGAAVSGAGIANHGSATLTNVTIADNEAQSSAGGGIYTDGMATTTMVNTLLADNLGHDCLGALTSAGAQPGHRRQLRAHRSG